MIVNWIPVTDKVPEVEDTGIDGLYSSDYILLSFTNYPLIAVGRYDVKFGDGAFYIGDSMSSCASMGVFVNAWMPVIPPYRDDEVIEPERKRDDVIVIEE